MDDLVEYQGVTVNSVEFNAVPLLLLDLEDLYAHLNGIRVLGSGGDGLVLHLLVSLIAASLFLVVFEGLDDGL